MAITQEKISTLAEFWPLAGSFFDGPVDDPKAREKFLEPQESRDGAGGRPRRALADLPEPWTEATVEEALRGVVERDGTQSRSRSSSLCGSL